LWSSNFSAFICITEPGEAELFLSVLASFFAGMLLEWRFKVLVIVPTTLVLVLGIAVSGAELWSIILLAVLVTIALQIGYLSGEFFAPKVVGPRAHFFPLLVCVAAVISTTIALTIIESALETGHVIMGYLLPAILIAIWYGSAFAAFTAFCSGVVAGYALLPPQFTFQIDNSLDVAELGFFMLLALIASKAVQVVARE
jgi:Domain of unknown function (DUF4118)